MARPEGWTEMSALLFFSNREQGLKTTWRLERNTGHMSRMSIGRMVGLVLGCALAFLVATAMYCPSEAGICAWPVGIAASVPGGIMGTAAGVVMEAVFRFLVDRKAKPAEPP